MRQSRHGRMAGFTTIELMVAAGIVALLVVIAVPLYQNYVTETRTTGALNALKALELEVLAPAEKHGGLLVCDNTLVSPANLKNRYLELSILAAPNDLSHPNGPAGLGAALNVTATMNGNNEDDVDVATMFYEEMKKTRPDSIIDGAVTDSAVAFAVRLSPPGVPYCDSSGNPIASARTTKGVNRPPVAGKMVDLGSTKEDTDVAINAARLISASWDPDGDALTVEKVTAASGTISGDSTTGFTYTPTSDFYGDDVNLSFEISDGEDSATGSALIDVTSVVDAPQVDLTLSAAQQVLDTGTDGRAVIDSLQTGGDLRGLSLEFSVVGRQSGSAKATTGPVIFNYGTQSDNNVISAWRPSNFTVALFGQDYDSGINIADGMNHRVTVSWSSTTGVLKIFDNGLMVKQTNDVGTGRVIPGNGHLVIGQKMNDPGSGGGWDANEHYNGQVFGTTLSGHTFTDREITDAPLYSRNQQMIADVRTEGNGMKDLLGKNNVGMQGNFKTSTVQVNTDLALIPPGSKVKLTVSAGPGDTGSQLSDLVLSGLAGLTVTDGTNSGSGSVNIINWDLGQLEIALPSGYTRNASITLKATATEGSQTASAEITKALQMAP